MAPRSLDDIPTDARSRLRASLAEPSANRDIASWLFSHSSRPFHRDGTPLAPASFNDNLTVCMSQKVGDSQTRPIHFLLLPVYVIDGIAVGYFLTKNDLSDSRLHPFGHGAHEKIGRFAFDPLSKHIVGVRHGVTDHTSAIFSLSWFRGHRRQRCYIAIPKHEYSYDNLPRTVLSITIKNELKIGTVNQREHRRSAEPVDRGTGTWSSNIDNIHPNVLYDYLPRAQTQRQGGFQLRRRDRRRSGRLDHNTVGAWLRDLEDCLEGRFHCPGVKKGELGSDGQVKIRTYDSVSATVFKADPSEDHGRLKQKAAQEYYTTVLLPR